MGDKIERHSVCVCVYEAVSSNTVYFFMSIFLQKMERQNINKGPDSDFL